MQTCRTVCIVVPLVDPDGGSTWQGRCSPAQEEVVSPDRFRLRDRREHRAAVGEATAPDQGTERRRGGDREHPVGRWVTS